MFDIFRILWNGGMGTIEVVGPYWHSQKQSENHIKADGEKVNAFHLKLLII